MARIRTIKPEIHTDDKTGTLSDRAFRLFTGLLNIADDYGVMAFSVAEFKALIFPYTAGDALEVVGDALFKELLPRGLVIMFSFSELDEGPMKSYLWVPNFLKHQKIDRPSQPLLAGWVRTTTPLTYCGGVQESLLDMNTDVLPSTNGTGSSHFSEGSLPAREGRERKGRERKGRERRGEEGKGSTTSSPALQDDLGFTEFWERYPKDQHGKKCDKAKTQRAWIGLSRDERQAALVGVGHYRTACDAGRFAKAPLVWIHGKCWGDWQEPPVLTSTTNGHHPTRSQNQINADIAARRMGLNPADSDPFGGAPDEPWNRRTM